MRLSTEEILKIPDLLLSPDEQNVHLALELLEHHSYAIPQILLPIEVFLAFNTDHNANASKTRELGFDLPYSQSLSDSIKTVLPNFSIENSPLYFIYLINHYSLKYDPSTITGYLDKIKLFIDQEPNYRQWLISNPERAEIYASIAHVIASFPKFRTDSMRYYEIALKNIPTNFEIYFNYAKSLRTHLSTGQPISGYKNKIIQNYTKAYKLNPTGDILNELASFYSEELNEPLQAKKTWEHCIEAHPTYPEALVDYAKFCIKENSWASAKILMQKNLALLASQNYVNSEETYYLLGYIEWKGYDYVDTAENYFIQAIAENEFYIKPVEALMELSLDEHDYNKAIQWHKLYLQHYPLDIPLMQTIGDLYLEIYDLEEAARYYTDILDLNAAYPPALEGLRKIQQL